MALINVWAKKMEGDAGEYIHFGATTMDIYDTLYILQLRASAKAMLKDMREIEDALLSHPDIARNLNPEELDTLLDPTKYIGLSPQVVDCLIEETQKFRATDPS